MACVRSAPLGEGEDPLAATEKAASTADAEVQATLDALLGSATVESAAATVAPTNTATPQPATATATLEQAQLTALSASLTAAAATPEPTLAVAEDEDAPTGTPTPQATSNACYGARYVYDESYQDGTRVDPGQSIVKTWRLQNVGTCDWRGGTYELIFSAGDRMGGTTPLTINITVPAGGYANFSVNLRAPIDPGTYHGDWLLRFDGDEVVGVGPDFNLPFWVEVIVRGATQTP
jgi:hypothetical protein